MSEWKQRIGSGKTGIGAALIGLSLLLLAMLTLAIPGRYLTVHNILHHLNFLPLMMAGILFGRNGAALAGFFALSLNTPLIAHHWAPWPANAIDQVLELLIFAAAGLIAGYLSDRERTQRRKLEKTKRELEEVYLELRENVEQMKRSERLLAAGRLAASLAHEIRNPLASIFGAAGILRRGAARPEYLADSLEIIQKESQRLNKLLTGFLNFAKPRSPRLQRIDLNALLTSVASLASHSADATRVSLIHAAAEGCPEVECDPEQFRQVLLNLVLNAVEASPAGAPIYLRTLQENNRMVVEVEDQGGGIPEKVADHIFDPFFTTKPKGTGLGLAVSSMIMEQHGGTLSFYRNPAGGTTFRAELPLGREMNNGQ